jgi:hypothetical protein
VAEKEKAKVAVIVGEVSSKAAEIAAVKVGWGNEWGEAGPAGSQSGCAPLSSALGSCLLGVDPSLVQPPHPLQDDAERDLAAAKPALDDALSALNRWGWRAARRQGRGEAG